MRVAFEYDRAFDPPAPVLPVRVFTPSGEGGVLLPCLVDSGADLSVVPVELALALQLPSVGTAEVEGVGDTIVRADLFAALLDVGGVADVFEVVALPGESLIGRNTLNRWRVHLDGPRLRFELS